MQTNSVPKTSQHVVQLGAEKQIRRILFLIMLFLFVVVIAVVVFLAVMNQRSTLRSSAQQQSTLAEFAGRNIELGLATGEMGHVKQTLERLQRFSVFEGAILYDAEMTPILTMPEGFPLPASITVGGIPTSKTIGDVSYEVTDLNDQSNEVIGRFLIAFTVAPVLSESRWALFYACGLGLMVLVPTMGLAAWRMSHLLKPIGLLENVLQSVALGDLTQQIHVHSKGVVGNIAAHLNRVIFTDLRGSFQAIARIAETLVGSSSNHNSTTVVP